MEAPKMIPFGAQYYRAPTPLPEDWEADLRGFRARGFNTVKIWAQWRWNMPAEDRFDFSDLDRLMDLCAQLDIRVVINVVYDVVPAWFNKKYPDAMMVTATGRRLYPQTTAWRQVGGVPGPCLHHPEGIEVRRRFTEAVAQRYAEHPALLCWDLWNEPEASCGLVRDATPDNLICYCEHSVAGFIDWLREKYGTPEAVAHRWGQPIRTWEDVEPPRYAGTFNDMLDWRQYFGDTLVRELHDRAEAVRRFDTVHPVMIHSVPGFRYMNSFSDEYDLAREMDWYGNSDGGSPYPACAIVSAARGKFVMNAEIHAMGGMTMERPNLPSFDDIKRHVMIPLARGVKGFLFWQYKPERLGLEAPAWGLTAPDGGDTPWLGYAQRINDALQRYAPRLLAASPRPSRVALVDSHESEVFLWAINHGSDDLFRCSLDGAFRALHEGQFAFDTVTERQIADEGLAGYDVVYYPLPYYLKAETAEVLRKFVKNGGTLISEALFGGIDSRTNLHAVRLPGYGFDEVFGCAETQTITASVFRNAYGARWADVDEDKTAVGLTDEQGRRALGYHFCESLRPEGATVLARFDNGDAAVTVHTYGKGRAVLIGTCPGYMVEKGSAETAAFISRLVTEIGGVEPHAAVEHGGRADVLYRDGQPDAVVLDRHSPAESGAVRLLDPTLAGRRLRNAITDVCLTVGEDGVCPIPASEGRFELYMVE